MTTSLPCPRCATELLLSMDRPHPRFLNTIYRRNLCPRCDAADPIAHGILAFFTVHRRVTEDNIAVFETLLREWIERTAEPPSVSPEAFAEDIEAFNRGDFDDF
ncbi:DUF6300 family protein [Micromonospora sp. WMMA1976]|uniref:DUF6300 family protein n=1 Tax=Micromonospora sp. WMMA1976 TaxID=3014995 RepID=UPI00248AC42A|nr:DUF6300 family protein [Micromonospora sp. WMMA1976]WBC01119.1 DUF6300 family protein [Micromonospora sp. WMMA1976]